MPFKSEKQRNWMKKNKPAMYRKWKAEHGTKIKPKPNKPAKKKG